MDILVNDKSLDFQLNETLTLPELLDNIQNWASKDNMFILDYSVNGQKNINEINDYNSGNIERLDVSVGSRETLVWENIIELQAYTHKIVSYIITRIQGGASLTPQDQQEIKTGISWMSNSCDSLLAFFNNESDVTDFTISGLNEILESGMYDVFMARFSILENQINIWKKQLFYNLIDSSDANELLVKYKDELKIILPMLEASAANLTIGKDKEALNTLEGVLEWLSLGFIVFEKAGIDKSVLENIEKILQEFDDSLKKRDFVTMADIIDFDLKEALFQLMNY
ncbi:MAG: hypothetical protein OEV66_05490 [Spirochaetia bacterium]|nr:hypothetical protein [Spirochaetia bacterium]